MDQIAQSGRKTVEASISGMKRIQTQMSSIGETIVKLSEQSQAIGEIIASVSDLAEQSNLLAVNAAIEAAKAGEQGKGFAVVALEVRNMAEQSKQATVQVRAILNDIQKAISAAVMATEQGSKIVESGVGQSGEVSQTIKVLADNANCSAQSAVQISLSLQQLHTGMDQVSSAMENIRVASQQNVVGVKQTEKASINLRGLGEDLSRLVQQNKELGGKLASLVANYKV
jgi:methyl-accepting chemotaxis protein